MLLKSFKQLFSKPKAQHGGSGRRVAANNLLSHSLETLEADSDGVSDFYGLQALGVLSYNIIRSIHSK
ncbi:MULTISPECIES: hypothetical protein [unclassified Wolbachia]|uniref:hypothetical protein n=1 Tax=unclassified Wolbachia TaxID=2640676 RepID=UPI002227AB3A|nr:hypothetical protein [Wolbachia endosymbiont (group A) of Sphecodes monilicornis]